MAEYLDKILQFFDLKTFFAQNSPVRLAFIVGFMILFWLAGTFLSNFLKKKLEKIVEAKTAPKTPEQGEEAALSRMDFSLFERVIKNAKIIYYLAILYWGLSRIIIGPLYTEIINLIFTVLCILAVIEFLIVFVPFNIDIYLRRRGATLKTSRNRSLMPIVRGVIWAIGLTFLMDNLGFHVSTIIAGLGIVGVAVGLAGQAILADFFSYIVILLDKPFQIGDFVELSDGKCGDVEYMGPKTTHLRNLNDDIIICPNSEMTKTVLINQGSIRERVVITPIGVEYETPIDKLEKMPDILREIVESVPNCRFDRACLTQFGDSSLNFQLLYFVEQKREDIRGFMITKSNVNIAILKRLNAEGISMAYPTEHVLLTDLDNPAPGPSTRNTHEGNPG